MEIGPIQRWQTIFFTPDIHEGEEKKGVELFMLALWC